MSLALTGRQDSAVEYSDLWKILEIYPRALFIIWDKAGHNFKIEQPILFNGLAQEWYEDNSHYYYQEMKPLQ